MHNNLARYNEKWKGYYQLHYYLVHQKDDGELVGLLLPGLGRFSPSRDCEWIMCGQNADAQVAAGNICMDNKVHDQAVRWYKQALVSLSETTQTERWRILHSIAKASFAAGAYEDAAIFGIQARHAAYGKFQNDLAVKIIFRSYVAMQKWDKAIDIGAPLYTMLLDSDILYTSSPIINDLAYAYSQKGRLYDAFDCALEAVDAYDLEDPDKELYIHAALNLLYYVAQMRGEADKGGAACGFNEDVLSKLSSCAAALKKFSTKHAWIQAYMHKYHGRYLVATKEAQRYLLKPTMCEDDPK
jgi:tetratricopeptide (TPR) repeat protein